MDPHAHPGPVASALAGRRQAWRPSTSRRSPRASWPARRRVPEDDCGLRSPLQRDRDRIVHCKAFRRLKHKTQVFVAPEGDHFRTRLTHTIEVTQISRTVARALGLNEDLVEAIGLGHDLGHAPFGHIGEDVLDRALAERFGGGFRHYEHSLRVVDVLEREGAGLNLTDDVRDGIVCHSGRAPMPRTLEGRIVRLVDRVAYINHDIDDSVRAGVLQEDKELPAEPIPRCSATPAHAGSTRSSTTSSRPRPSRATSSRAPRRARRWTRCGTSCSSASTSGAAARREHVKTRAGRADALRPLRGPTRCGCPDGGGSLPGADTAQRVTDYLAGMTHRDRIRAFEALAVPESFAVQ